MRPLYYKRFTGLSDDRPGRSLSLNGYVSNLDFGELILGEHRGKFRSIDETALADFIAATIAHLHERGFLTNAFVKQHLACCRDIMLTEGYRESFIGEGALERLVQDETVKNVIVIAGCQTEKLLTNRAAATAILIEAIIRFTRHKPAMPKPLVVFSGAATDQQREITIPDESVRMHKQFLSIIRKSLNVSTQELKQMVDIHKESRSRNTAQNIRYTLTGFAGHHARCSINLFVISSNFHLPRLADITASQLDDPTIAGLLARQGIAIDSLWFMGAESEENDNTIYHRAYVKAMFYEVYHYLLAHGLIERQ